MSSDVKFWLLASLFGSALVAGWSFWNVSRRKRVTARAMTAVVTASVVLTGLAILTALNVIAPWEEWKLEFLTRRR